jgi:hypothetical protein
MAKIENLIRKESLELEDISSSKDDVEWVADTNRILIRSGFRPRGSDKWVDKPVQDIADKLYVQCLKILAAQLESGTIEIQAMGLNNVYTCLRATDILLTQAKFLDQVQILRVRRGTEYEKEDVENPGQTETWTSYLYGIMIVLQCTLDKKQLTQLLSLLGVSTKHEQPQDEL